MTYAQLIAELMDNTPPEQLEGTVVVEGCEGGLHGWSLEIRAVGVNSDNNQLVLVVEE